MHQSPSHHSRTTSAVEYVLRLQWLYKTKSDEAGFLSRIKARLVADGSREKGVLPAGDIYTPVMVMSTVRIMLAVGLQYHGVRFHQLDIVSAYSTALCTREIFVHYPPGRFCPAGPGKCMRTIKALYGVVDSGRLFYDEWVQYHLDLGFQPIHSDKCFDVLRGTKRIHSTELPLWWRRQK